MKQRGLATFIDPGADRPLLEVATAACVHCGGHFPIRPGSGIVRGWCQNCNGPVCGPGCATCVPLEQYLANLEAGMPPELADQHKPVRVPTTIYTGE